MHGSRLVTDGETELGLTMVIDAVDRDLSAEGNGRACPNEGRQKEEEGEQGGKLLHGFPFIGQLLGQVKGTGAGLTPAPCSQAGGLGSGLLTLAQGGAWIGGWL